MSKKHYNVDYVKDTLITYIKLFNVIIIHEFINYQLFIICCFPSINNKNPCIVMILVCYQ